MMKRDASISIFFRGTLPRTVHMNNTRGTVHMNSMFFEAKARKARIRIFEKEEARVEIFALIPC